MTLAEFYDIMSVSKKLKLFSGGVYMKSTGIVRRVDEVGRIVLPMEIRKSLNIDTRDPVEIFVDSNQIILRKYEPACIFCGNADDVRIFKGRIVCKNCAKELSK